jgi:multisubunit Na+/H+ antiporter MnhE subunit
MRNMKGIVLFVVSIGVLFLLWALLTSGFKAQESLVGVFAAIFSALVYQLIRAKSGRIFAPSLRDVLEAWRLPWYLLSGSWEIVQVLFEDLLGVRKAGSFYRSVSFGVGDEQDPSYIARRALATAYTTVAPNFIVVGIDARRKQLLFHQLRKSSVPKMTKKLGAGD